MLVSLPCQVSNGDGRSPLTYVSSRLSDCHRPCALTCEPSTISNRDRTESLEIPPRLTTDPNRIVLLMRQNKSEKRFGSIISLNKEINNKNIFRSKMGRGWNKNHTEKAWVQGSQVSQGS